MSFTVSASGALVPPRAVFAGVRNLAKTKLENLPRDGQSGEWEFSYMDNGWVKQTTYLDILKDLAKYIHEKQIPTPVLLFIDGASCHISLEMADFCTKHGIQPILLRPNTTHLTQALDLTFFASLKVHLKQEQELWHRDPLNIGNALSKYSVIHLVHKVTEQILLEKPHLISKGFKKAGIHPWNPLAPSKSRMTPSQVYSADITDVTKLQQLGTIRTIEASVDDSAPLPTENEGLVTGYTEVVQKFSQEEEKEETLVDNIGRERNVSNNVVVTAPVVNNNNTVSLPPFTERFLAKFELLLSEEQLDQFSQLLSSNQFSVDNPQYQAWLVLKCASLPIGERLALEQVVVCNI